MGRKSKAALQGSTRRRPNGKGLKRSSAQRRSRLSIEPLEARHLLATLTFQHGIGGYEGTQDTVIFSRDRDSNFGTEGHISADQQDFDNVRQGLLRFDNIVGNQPGQIPKGATINSARLELFVQDSSNATAQISFYRMLTNWSEAGATWNFFGAATGGIGGVQASEGESTDLPPDAVLLDSKSSLLTGTNMVIDVTKSLEYWAAGTNNFGWLIESAATNGWDFRTSESDAASRPKLIVDFNAPAATGNFQVISTTVSQAEGNSLTRIAKVDVARLGDISSAASINYTVTAGTATATDDFVEVATPQALNFAANQALATIEVTIKGDTLLEGFETVLVMLSGGSVVAGRDVATLSIADDDILINEILAQVSNSSDDETDREYIELIGTPNQSLAGLGYYFVVFEGEEEENSGAGSGRADFVIDLAPYTFGTNGLLVFVPGDPNVSGRTWKYDSIADQTSTIVELTALMGVGGVLEDSSQTYAIIRSPSAITQGTDYDTVGAYEVPPPPNTAETSIGVGVGILDQLPVGAQLIDSVGVQEGGSGDRDRVATTAAQGHPGIHVHQPTGLAASGGSVTTPDAISRRQGQTLPNSIGVWYNGEITNGNAVGSVVPYLEDSVGTISVVAPDGALLTPGANNFLRNVFFRVTDQNKDVAEADGSVTIRIERTGNIATESLMVTYTTVDFGSATENADYTGVTNTVTFNPGDAFKDITIDINELDGLSEGFERFRVRLSNATGGYVITNGLPTSATTGNANGEATIKISDANVSIATFQDGNANGYDSTSDAYLNADGLVNQNLKFGQDLDVRVDQAQGATNAPSQALLKFADLFGAGMGQVPVGSKIFDAFLTLNVTATASGADIRLFRMLKDWEQVNATWNDPQGSLGSDIGSGITPDGVEATAQADAVVTEPGKGSTVQIPLNVDTIQSWADGSLANYGWAIISDDPANWWFNSSEAFDFGTFRPELTILYTSPVDTDKGTFSIATDKYAVTEDNQIVLGNTGTATITVNRIGGSDGAATVNWSITDGTGTVAADLTGATSGSLSFADGELFETFTVTINDDVALERNETLNLTISGTGLTFEQSTATLTIRDDDFNPLSGNLLLNELFINSPGNDPPHEFVELRGLANMGMGSLYYVAVEGLIGPTVGAFEKVVDLGPYFNGANGLSLLTTLDAGFAYNVNSATTHIEDLGPLGVENVASNNDSTSYVLLYSPFRELADFAFDYDWNNDGSLELPFGAELVDVLGIRSAPSDQLYGPTSSILSFTVQEVDAISRKRSDVDRNDGTAWFGGNLTSAGDDYLLYEASSTSLPIAAAGNQMTPGDVNTGTAVDSPLVKLTSLTPNANGTVTLNFNGPVSQVLVGDNNINPIAPATGPGITITNTSGVVLATVDSRPTVAGLGTNTLTLSFSGSGVVGGFLPAGNYQLNFVGNGMVGNGRSVDVANNDTTINGYFESEFTVVAAQGDYNMNGVVDTADYVVWRKAEALGSTTLDNRGPGIVGAVGQADYDFWRSHFGNGSTITFPASSAGGEVAVAAAVEAMAAVSTPEVTKTEPVVAPVVAAKARDNVLVDWPSSSAAVKAATAKVASSARGLSAKSTASDSLLLADRKTEKRDRSNDVGQAGKSRQNLEPVDEFFSKLGKGRSKVGGAVESFARSA